MDSGVQTIKTWLVKEKFTFLLFSLVFYTLAASFFEGILPKGYFLRASFVIFLVTAVFAVSSRKKDLVLVSIFAVLSIVFLGCRLFFSNHSLLIMDKVIKIIFNGCLIYIITGHSYRCSRVTRNTICAALIGYVLLSLLWANLYFIIELTYPNSFTLPHEEIMADPSILQYFSFVTITTLGYGDISPVASQARDLTVLEAFVGQMYMAILIARLVAIHTARATEKE